MWGAGEDVYVWVILYLTSLYYYGLLEPFFPPSMCVRNVILHQFRYKEVRLYNFNLCFRTI